MKYGHRVPIPNFTDFKTPLFTILLMMEQNDLHQFYTNTHNSCLILPHKNEMFNNYMMHLCRNFIYALTNNIYEIAHAPCNRKTGHAPFGYILFIDGLFCARDHRRRVLPIQNRRKRRGSDRWYRRKRRWQNSTLLLQFPPAGPYGPMEYAA